jgi:hypothetical protein
MLLLLLLLRFADPHSAKTFQPVSAGSSSSTRTGTTTKSRQQQQQ